MNRFLSRFVVPLVALALSFGTAVAGPGHDHGDEAPASPTGPAAPRFEAQSDLFEVVGVFDGHELSVFVDRYADNAPVLKATVEMESGATKATGEFHEDSGDYKFAAEAFEKPGEYPVTLTIAAGEDVDILAANLVIPEGHDDHTHDDANNLYQQAGITAGVVILLAILLLGARRAVKRRSVKGLK